MTGDLIINVKVRTRARTRSVTEDGDGYLVLTNSPPLDDKANRDVIELLSKHFKVAKSKIELVSGSKSRHKIFKITA